MAKGVSIKFKSYQETVLSLFKVIKLSDELKKYKRIVIKPSLRQAYTKNTEVQIVEEIVKYCLANKSADSEVIIAEGSDGDETGEIFEIFGYNKLSEKYSLGMVDLNNADVDELINGEFSRFDVIHFPKILEDSFVISVVPLTEDEESGIYGSLANMLGAFPSKYYKGFFSRAKSKIRKWPIRYSIHDILKCKMPNLAVVDASLQGLMLAGQPLEVDKQSAKLLGKEWKSIDHLRLVEESFAVKKDVPKSEIKPA